MSSAGRIDLDLNINNRRFGRQVDNIQRSTTKAFGAMSIAVGNIVSNMVQNITRNVASFVDDCIDKGSELSELQNVVDSVFTTMSDKVESFADNALEQYGLTEAQAKKMVGTYGAMAKAFNYTEGQALSMSETLTGLTADVASFYNLDHDVAYTKMKSVFTGETESLKELGIVMTQAALNEFALQKGYQKSIKQMTEKEKVALRLAFIQDKLSHAEGDFLKTQDQWANQTRILTGQFESFKAALGAGFINVLTPVIQALNVLMAKLVQVAEAFKSFTEMLMGNKSKGGSGQAMAAVAEAADAAAGSTSDIEDAAEGAAGAAKKAQKSLMGFDEINKLTSNNSSSDGAALDEVSFDSIDMAGAVEEQTKKVNSLFDIIMARVDELFGKFKEGIDIGLGDDFGNSIDRTKEHIEGIGNSMRDIALNGGVLRSLNTMLDKMAMAAGKMVGSFASVGASIGEMIIGGIDKYFEQNKSFIKDRLVGMFDSIGNIWGKAGNLSQSIASIFEVFRGNEAKQCISDFMALVVNQLLALKDLSLRVTDDLFGAISQPIIDNSDKIKLALEGMLTALSTILSTLANSVTQAWEKVFEVYESKVSPAIQLISEGISSVFGTILDAFNNYVSPAIQRLADQFSEMWSSKVQPVINAVIEFVGKVAQCISVLWKNVVAPFIEWLVNTIIPVLTPIIEGIYSTIIDVIGNIMQALEGIIQVLSGIIDFITGVFSGDWESCWEGIKQIFEGFVNTFTGLMEGLWNIIYGIIDAAIQVIFGLFQLLWETVIGIINTAINAISSVISTGFDLVIGVLSNWGENVKWFFSTLWESVSSTIGMHLNNIKNIFVSIFTGISNVVTSIFNGLWTVIKNVINKILGGVEKLANGVVSGLNSVISSLNGLEIDIPDWVPGLGGGTLGFDIPSLSSVSLPRLAEGGFVKANQPQPVIVGDNRTQGEIIAPEGKILSLVLEALETFFGKLVASGYTSNNNNDTGDIVIPIYLDGTLLDEVIVTAQQRRNVRSGGRA